MRFGRWTVLEEVRGKNNLIFCKCRCDCGTERLVRKSHLIDGRSRSCGCYQKEVLRKIKRKTNKYRMSECGGFIIGTTTNTNRDFFIDAEDYEKVKNLSWYETNKGYLAHYENRKLILMHRLITNAPDGLVVDHKNHNTLDNRKENLRVCTQKENRNNPKQKPKNIYEIRRGLNKYYMVEVKGKYLGIFKKYEDAEKRRDEYVNEIKKEA